MGHIDLVWGANAQDLKGLKDVNGKTLKPYGLSKILEKHASDFESFKGASTQDKLINGITQIIEQGEIKDKDGVKTIHLYNDFGEFKVGLSKGWDKKGENTWVITAYRVRTPSAQLSDQAQLNKGMGYSSPKGEVKNSTSPLKTLEEKEKEARAKFRKRVSTKEGVPRLHQPKMYSRGKRTQHIDSAIMDALWGKKPY